MDNRPIGIFDSGIGGVSILNELFKELKNEKFIYLADNKNCPYGNKSKKEVGEKDYLTISDRLSSARGGWYPNTYGPTSLHMNSFNMAKELFTQMQPKADDYISKVNNMVSRFEEAGGPTILK